MRGILRACAGGILRVCERIRPGARGHGGEPRPGQYDIPTQVFATKVGDPLSVPKYTLSTPEVPLKSPP